MSAQSTVGYPAVGGLSELKVIITRGLLTRDRLWIEGDGHGSNRADRHTQATTGAFFRIKKNGHFRAFDGEGAGGAETGAGTTLEAFFVISCNDCGEGFDGDSLLLDIVYPGLNVLFMAGQLEHHDAVLLEKDVCLQNIELNVVVLDQIADDWLAEALLGESQ